MEPLFKKILTLNTQGKGHKNNFICRCVINGDDGPNYCSMKFNTFKSVVPHLMRFHKIVIPNEIICYQCETLFSSTCQVIDHYRKHIDIGCEVFNQEDENQECVHCRANLNCIKLCRASSSCVL